MQEPYLLKKFITLQMQYVWFLDRRGGGWQKKGDKKNLFCGWYLFKQKFNDGLVAATMAGTGISKYQPWHK